MAKLRKNLKAGPYSDQTKPPPGPPKSLRTPGQALWMRVQEEYAIRDAGGVAILTQICEAEDRIAQYAEAVARDGVTVVNGSGGRRDHPLLKHETQLRMFIVRALQRLGLTTEALYDRPGRPVANVPVPYGISIDGEDDDGGIETNSN